MELASPPLVIHFNSDHSPGLEERTAPSVDGRALSLSPDPPLRASSTSPSPDLTRPPMVGGWKVGDSLDALDTVNTWLEARVLDVNVKEDLLYIHFEGWGQSLNHTPHRPAHPRGAQLPAAAERALCASVRCAADKWNEWIPLRSKRLARYRSNTAIKGVDRAFNLRLEAEGLQATMSRLTLIRQSLEARAKEMPEPPHPPITSSHPFAPLSSPLSSLISADDLTFLTVGDNYKFVGHVVNAQVEDQSLLLACISFLRANVSFVSYAFLTEPALALPWCELLARLMGGSHHYFYSHFGVMALDKEEDVEAAAGEKPREADAPKVPRALFASRESASKKGQSVNTFGASPGVGPPRGEGQGLSYADLRHPHRARQSLWPRRRIHRTSTSPHHAVDASDGSRSFHRQCPTHLHHSHLLCAFSVRCCSSSCCCLDCCWERCGSWSIRRCFSCVPHRVPGARVGRHPLRVGSHLRPLLRIVAVSARARAPPPAGHH